MGFEIRPIHEDELPTFVRTDSAAFGGVPSDEDIELMRHGFEFDRSLAAFDGSCMVGTAGAYSFDLTLPGLTSIPVAGVSWVGVLPTHRRRGILTDLMRRQLTDVRERGEPAAILLCSESLIYGRFGYGIATTQTQLEIDKRYGTFARPIETPGQLSMIDRDAARAVLPEVYDRVRLRQPGAVSRRPIWWDGYLRDPESHRRGMSPRFYVTYAAPSGQVDGYVGYRVQSKWEEGNPGGTLMVSELMATTLAALAVLWRYCLNVDLITTVRAPDRPVDDPLRWMLAEPRRLRFTSYGDHLWLRILDLPVALSTRRYAASDRLVLEIGDTFCPENAGRYSLVGGPDGAECHSTSAEPDLSLDITDLSACYLGGVRFSTLAAAGRIGEHTAGSLRRADALFASEPLPWCATSF